MIDLSKVKKFAKEAHTGQFRKYTNQPYIVHPMAVARTVKLNGGTPEMIAAAMLHDVVEDTSVSIEEIGKQFGTIVASYVSQLTDPVVEGNRATRIAANLVHTSKMCASVQTIKLADILDNLDSIKKYDEKFYAVWSNEKLNQLRYLTHGNTKLYEEAFKKLNNLL